MLNPQLLRMTRKNFYFCSFILCMMKTKKYKCNTLVITSFVILLAVSCGSRQQGQSKQPVADDESKVQSVPEGWELLFDGKTLAGWDVVRSGGEGEPYVKNGTLVLPMAVSGTSTGVYWVGDPLPVNNYAICAAEHLLKALP